MKKLLLIAFLSLSTSFGYSAEVKEVCRDVVKKGKTVKECKKIKVHKKLDGTTIPTKK